MVVFMPTIAVVPCDRIESWGVAVTQDPQISCINCRLGSDSACVFLMSFAHWSLLNESDLKMGNGSETFCTRFLSSSRWLGGLKQGSSIGWWTV